MLNVFEKQKQKNSDQSKFTLQFKKNGACNVTIISPDKKIQTWNRHKEAHRAWTHNSKTMEPMLDVSKGWTVFVSELLHSKSERKDTQYIFDILVYNSDYMVGSTFKDRQDLLWDMFSSDVTGETLSHFVITDKIWLAKNHTSGFKALFDGISEIEDEGVVLKMLDATLEMANKESANEKWSIKSRKQHKNFGF